MLEEFICKALDLLDKLDELGNILTNPELPENLNGAQCRLEEHNQLKRRVNMAPVEQLGMEGQRILMEITGDQQQGIVYCYIFITSPDSVVYWYSLSPLTVEHICITSVISNLSFRHILLFKY